MRDGTEAKCPRRVWTDHGARIDADHQRVSLQLVRRDHAHWRLLLWYQLRAMGAIHVGWKGMSVSLPSSKDPAAEYVKTASLKPWKRNPRKNAEAITKVAVSIETFGFGAPILVRKEDNRIIAGHTRWEAAKRLGMDTVPVRKLDLTEEKANALALADNKLGEIATWDDEQLKSILAEMQSFDETLVEIAGFSESDLSKLFSEDDSDSSPQLSGLKYSVVVDCNNEAHQAEMLEDLEARGLTCRPLIS